VQKAAERGKPTADHTKFEALKGPFETGPDVTRACLTCHTEAAGQVMKTIHWSWVCPKAMKERIGKSVQVINNFCIALPSNEPRCTSCHVGYGWKDKDFDFKDETLVDCLICHDTTGSYRKLPAGAGHPAYVPTEFDHVLYPAVDLAEVARRVGPPSRQTCGACHFFGGGGDLVKHGDLDSALIQAAKELDVHMNAAGANFSCQACHTTKEHDIAGRCYTIPPELQDQPTYPGEPLVKLSCPACHGLEPHEFSKLNHHADRVVCQTCHIPAFARAKATNMDWDWSTAGRFDAQGRPYKEKDAGGNASYATQKGSLTWEKDVVPEYLWFNGRTSHVLLSQPLGEARPVEINSVQGAYGDGKIWPFKVHTGKQPYDVERGTFVVPKLFGPKGSGAYWSDYNWEASIRAGMDYVGEPYSGRFGFVETVMYWPISHMVAPKEAALSCESCHARTGGRLEKLAGFYMPGRDRSRALDAFGWLAVFGTLAGVFVHGGVRVVLRARRGVR
jgi:octaheme c-type cytochrome (tetrathionate reductase family)